MSNKAQVQARVIIYVLAVFIAGTILLYGYTVVKGLLVTQEQVQLLDFEKQMKGEVKSSSFSFRDVKQDVFTLPANFDSICFANIDSAAVLDFIDDDYILIRDSVEDGVKRNVFLLSDGRMKYGFYTGKIGVNIYGENNYGCLDVVNGNVKLRLKALGRQVSVSEW
ncbi:hypothetical protein KY316_01480 [Candidatus Woesearchaeota archaeon]|nr:hypothetical protein [Candidatus Woesearchaeota archaeon]